MSKFIYLGLGSIFMVILLLMNSIFVVEQSQKALVFQFGDLITDVPCEAGLHFKIPFIQNVKYFDNRILDIESEPREVITNDQKRLIIDAYIKYHIVDPLKFYRSVHDENGLRSRLLPVVESVIRGNVGTVPLTGFLKEYRENTMDLIKNFVALQALDFGIKIVDVRIKKTDLPLKNSESIFRRMQTEREKEAKEIRAEGIEEYEKIKAGTDKEKRVILASAAQESEILRGKGDAEASAIFNGAFSKDEEFFQFYRSMNAYKEVFDKKNTSVLLSTDSEFFRIMNNKK